MCEGEYESLKAIHAVSPGFVPQPYAWGKYAEKDPETYFLLAEFRDVGKQVRAARSALVRKGSRWGSSPATRCSLVDVRKYFSFAGHLGYEIHSSFRGTVSRLTTKSRQVL